MGDLGKITQVGLCEARILSLAIQLQNHCGMLLSLVIPTAPTLTYAW